jgi:plastocyanin
MKPSSAITAATALVVLGVALPAQAATPTFRGSVGPSFTISMAAKPTKAGKITLVVNDKGSSHNFHLRGPGGKEIAGIDAKTKKAVSRIATGVGSTGTRTFVLTLKRGTYRFVCDPHSSELKGSFTVK